MGVGVLANVLVHPVVERAGVSAEPRLQLERQALPHLVKPLDHRRSAQQALKTLPRAADPEAEEGFGLVEQVERRLLARELGALKAGLDEQEVGE